MSARSLGATAARKAPARAGGPVPAESGSLPGRLPALALLALARNPLRSAGAALALVLTAACLWNALMGQRSRHPAPLFGPASAPIGQPASGPASGSVDTQRRAEAPPIPTPRPDPATVASVGTRAADPIGGLIRSEGAKAEAAAKPPAVAAEVAKPDGSKADATRIASAQRTLSRLGYGPLTADGVMGPGTRAAVERFERDRKLPVTGAIAGRTAKLLGIDGA